MADAAVHDERVKLLRDAFDAFGRGDVDWLAEHLTENVVWHVGGHNSFSGDYTGRDAVLNLFHAAREATNGTITFTPNDVIADHSHAVALGEGGATNSRGERVSFDFALVVHAEDDRATEIWDVSSVSRETDEFFDRLGE